MSGRNKKIITTVLLLLLAAGLSGYYIYDNLPAFRSVFIKKNQSLSININDFKTVINEGHIAESNETSSFGDEEPKADEDGLIGRKIEITGIPKELELVSLFFTINDYYFIDGMPEEIPEDIRILRENYFNRYYADEGGLPLKIKCLVVDMDAYNQNEETVLFLWNGLSLVLFDDEGKMTGGGDLEYMSVPYSMGTDMFYCYLESGQTSNQKLYFLLPEKFLEGKEAGLMANFTGNYNWVQSGKAPVFMLDKERKQ